MGAKKIKWTLLPVRAGDLKPNPHNPKKRDDAGFAKLKRSVERFGLVFSGIVNKDLAYIDGHSRNELSGPDAMVNVFVPSRQLTEKECMEMNAIYDIARAGEVDLQILESNMPEAFFTDWDIDKSKNNIVHFEAKPKVAGPKWPLLIICDSDKHRKTLIEQFKKRNIKMKLDT